MPGFSANAGSVFPLCSEVESRTDILHIQTCPVSQSLILTKFCLVMELLKTYRPDCQESCYVLDIHGPQWLTLNDFGDPWTFALATSSG